jgi:DNA invertase Pin-like site-specific DNA recombinase
MSDSPSSLEYVIYCRKSTDESSDHQKQSIPDQIKACIDYAKREGHTIAKKPKNFEDFQSEMELYKEENESDLESRRIYRDTAWLFIIKEQETAKIPYKRKKWRKLMEMIAKWKIGGLLSYAPDRQARNMLEGGELINHVDEWLIDLKYTNFHFENNASGKMMLGIWFVFSKQYSDKLSEDITRWNKTTVSKGKGMWRYFPWYQINKEGFHEPHPVNFRLMKEAFMRKLDGETDEKIGNFLNANGYKRTILKSEEDKEMNPKNIYKLWINPFYYGMFVHGQSIRDLREENDYYQPMISEEQHAILKERYDNKNKKIVYGANTDEYSELRPFDNDFIVDEDGNTFSFWLPNKKRFNDKIEKAKKEGKIITLKDIVQPHQMTYSCGNKHSKSYGVSATAQDIDKAIIERLKSFQVSEKDFASYKNFASVKLKEIGVSTMEQINLKQLEINRLKWDKLNYIDKHMSTKKDREEERIYEKKKADFEAKIKILKSEIEDLDEGERNEIVEIEAMMSVMFNADKYYKKANYVQKRKIVKILFLKPELEGLFSLNGGGDGNRTHVSASVPSRLLL